MSQHRKENGSVSKGSGVSRGDKRRNARLAELRLLVPRENAIAGIDLAEDNQAVVVTDHDSKVLARRSPRCKAWQLGEVLDWAVGKAKARGFESVTVACEPTGSRWMHVQQACAERGLNFVCVQTLVTHNARVAEDYTRDKSDQKDAVLIARLTAELRCYRPEVIEEEWAVLRYLGQRRDALVTEALRCRQQITDRLALAWQAALGDSRGAVPARRRGALKLAGHALADLRRARELQLRAEAEMIAQLDVLGITDVLASIEGLSLPVAACILAEIGDPARFGSSRALVKHAGVAPCDNSSGNSAGQARISRRGRPVLRKTAWRGTWAMIHGANPVLAAKYGHLTSRDTGKLAKGQAHIACVATLLRWIYSVITTGTAWDRRVAGGTISHTAALAA